MIRLNLKIFLKILKNFEKNFQKSKKFLRFCFFQEKSALINVFPYTYLINVELILIVRQVPSPCVSMHAMRHLYSILVQYEYVRTDTVISTHYTPSIVRIRTTMKMLISKLDS